MVNKATAPAPPPKSFTGEVPRPGLGQKVSDWHRQRVKRPIHINIGSGSQPASGQRRRRRATRLPRGHVYRRRPQRGTLMAVLGVAIAATALTLATIEFVSWTTATGLGFAAEGVTMLTAYCFGEPSDDAKLKRAQRANQPPKPPRQRQAPQKSGGHKCGAATQGGKGAPCQRPVSKAGEHCWEHPGGQSSAQTPSSQTGTAKRRSGPKKKGAAPPALPAGTP